MSRLRRPIIAIGLAGGLAGIAMMLVRGNNDFFLLCVVGFALVLGGTLLPEREVRRRARPKTSARPAEPPAEDPWDFPPRAVVPDHEPVVRVLRQPERPTEPEPAAVAAAESPEPAASPLDITAVRRIVAPAEPGLAANAPPATAPVVEAPPEPAPVVEAPPEPASVVEAPPEPAPVVEAPPEPAPIVEAPPEPAPVAQAPPEPASGNGSAAPVPAAPPRSGWAFESEGPPLPQPGIPRRGELIRARAARATSTATVMTGVAAGAASVALFARRALRRP